MSTSHFLSPLMQLRRDYDVRMPVYLPLARVGRNLCQQANFLSSSQEKCKKLTLCIADLLSRRICGTDHTVTRTCDLVCRSAEATPKTHASKGEPQCDQPRQKQKNKLFRKHKLDSHSFIRVAVDRLKRSTNGLAQPCHTILIRKTTTKRILIQLTATNARRLKHTTTNFRPSSEMVGREGCPEENIVLYEM